MRAHVIINGKVSNTIVVDSLDFMPGLLDAAQGGTIGDLWNGTAFSKPAPIPMPEPERIAALWQAAHDYEFAQISGSAIGLITMGVMQAKPKCLAVQGWIKSIWTAYYTRKANGSTDTSFAMVGPIPHSIPELMTELGV